MINLYPRDIVSRGGLDLADLAVPYTPFTLNRQNRNQVCWNICSSILQLLYLPRLCGQNSHVTCFKTRWWSTRRCYILNVYEFGLRSFTRDDCFRFSHSFPLAGIIDPLRFIGHYPWIST